MYSAWFMTYVGSEISPLFEINGDILSRRPTVLFKTYILERTKNDTRMTASVLI